MTSSVIKKYVLAALCGAAIVGVGQTAQAASLWDISGGVNAGLPNYGVLPGQNNVLNQLAGMANVFDDLLRRRLRHFRSLSHRRSLETLR